VSRAAASRLAHAALLAAALTLAMPAAVAAPAVGKAAPDFELPGAAASRVQLAALRGKVVYLDFWASWCPACQQAFPWLNAMQERYGARGLQIVGVSVDVKREEAEAFLADHPAKFLVGFDVANRLPRVYNVRGMPTSLLIGTDGRIRMIHESFAPADEVMLEAAIKDALEAP
jgi:peroxiredoxin